MNKCLIIEYIYYFSQIVAVFIGLCGVVVTIIGISKFLRHKRIDALYGFYTKFSRISNLLRGSLGNADEHINILYAFCADENLRMMIQNQDLEDFHKYRKTLINLILNADNQIDLDEKHSDISELIDTLLVELSRYDSIDYLFNVDGGQRLADEANKNIKNQIDQIQEKIKQQKKKYRIAKHL